MRGEMDVNEIIESIPMLNQVAHIKEYQLMNVDSNEMTPQRWIMLSRQINELVERDDIDGIVVTHGTDTLDETAYFLNLTLHTSKPVVVTGAMRLPQQPVLMGLIIYIRLFVWQLMMKPIIRVSWGFFRVRYIRVEISKKSIILR